MKLILIFLIMRLTRTGGGGYDEIACGHRWFGRCINGGDHRMRRRWGGWWIVCVGWMFGWFVRLLLYGRLLLQMLNSCRGWKLVVLLFGLFECDLKFDSFGLQCQVRIIAERRTMARTIGDRYRWWSRLLLTTGRARINGQLFIVGRWACSYLWIVPKIIEFNLS